MVSAFFVAWSCFSLLAWDHSPATEAVQRLADELLRCAGPGGPKEDRLSALQRLAWGLAGLPRLGALAQLTKLADDPDPEVRASCLIAVYSVARDHGLPCPMVIVKALVDSDHNVRLTASAYLDGFRSFPVEGHEALLTAATSSTDRFVRRNLIAHLPDILRGHPQLIPALEAGTRDTDLNVRSNAFIGIWKATGDLERVIDFQLEMCSVTIPKDKSGLTESEKQDWEVTELCQLGWATKAHEWSLTNPERYLVALLKRARSDDPKKRGSAAWLLGVVGAEDARNRDLANKHRVAEVLQHLTKEDPDERVRFYAAKAVERLHSKSK